MTCKVEVLNILASIFPNMTIIEFMKLVNAK